MEPRRLNPLKVITPILGLLLAAIVAWTLHTEQQEQLRRNEYLQEFNAALAPYTQEKQQLLSELSTLQQGFSYRSDRMRLMVGFLLSDRSDIAYIQQKAQVYGFNPVLMIACTQDAAQLAQWLADVPDAWEILLYAPEYSPELPVQIQQMRELLKTLDRQDTDVFYIRSNQSNLTVDEIAAQCGMGGYAAYHSAPDFGQHTDGTVFFDYANFKLSHFEPQSIRTLETRLKQWHNSNAPMLCIFDAAMLQSQQLSESMTAAVFEKIRQYSAMEDSGFATVSDTFSQLSKINQLAETFNTQAAQRSGEIQHRLDELEEIIAGLYRQYRDLTV